MYAELAGLDDGAGGGDGEAAEPLGANVLVSLLEREMQCRTDVQVRKMEEEAHVERLSDRPELLHQRVVEADEMLILERLHDGSGEHDRACLNRVAREFAALDPDLREDVERVLDEPAVPLFEM